MTGTLLGTGALARVRSVCHPCEPGHGAETSITGTGKLRPLTLGVCRRGPNFSPLRCTTSFVGSRIPSYSTTVTNTGSVVTRVVSSSPANEGRLHCIYHTRKSVISGNTGSSLNICRTCNSCHRPITGVTGREVLTIGHNRGRNFLGISLSISGSDKLNILAKLCIGGSSTYTSLIHSTTSSTCAHLIFPDVRERVEGRLASHTYRSSVGIFSGGATRLLVRPPIGNGMAVKLSPNCQANYGITIISRGNGILSANIVCYTPPRGGVRRTGGAVGNFIGGCGIGVFTVKGNATSRRARIFTTSIVGRLSYNVICVIMDRTNTSICSTSGLTTRRFPRCSISLHSTISVTEHLRSPLTRLIGVSPGTVNINRCRRSVPRGRLSTTLSNIIRSYMGSINISLGATSPSLLLHISNISSTVTGGVTTCERRGNAFASHSRLGGIPGLNPGTFRRYTNFLEVSRSGRILSGATIRPRSCPTTGRLLGVYNISRDSIHKNGVSTVGSTIRARNADTLTTQLSVNRPALGSVVSRLNGPNESPHRRLPRPVLEASIVNVRSLGRNVRLGNAMHGIVSFNTFISIKIRRSKLIRVSRVAGHCVGRPSSILGINSVIAI